MITIYSKPNCPACNRTKKLLSDHAFNYSELIVGQDVTRDTVLEKFPGVKMVPIIIVGDVRIETENELKQLIESGQISSLLN